MATATKKNVVRETVQTTVEERIVLELTREEALTLRIVTGAIGGSSQSRRKDTNAIYAALGAVGIQSPNIHAIYPSLGSLYFKEEIGQ